MNVNESGHFDPECLAKWLKVSREYLLAPPEESRCVATGEGPLRRQAAQDPGGRNRRVKEPQHRPLGQGLSPGGELVERARGMKATDERSHR